MIVHQCEGCEKISINRIAADDDADRILAVLDASAGLEESCRQNLAEQGILPLDLSQRWVVMLRLFGSVDPVCPGRSQSGLSRNEILLLPDEIMIRQEQQDGSRPISFLLHFV